MSTESHVTAQRPEDLDDRVAALAVLATNIESDAERLRDLVAELAADGAKVPDGIDELVDRLVAPLARRRATSIRSPMLMIGPKISQTTTNDGDCEPARR